MYDVLEKNKVQLDLLRESVLESTSLLVIATDMQGKVLLFNASSERTIGYPAEEVIGTHSPALWHDPKEVHERAAELSIELDEPIEPGFDVFTKVPLLRGRESRNWHFIRKNGTRFLGRLTVTVLKDSWGHPSGFLGVIEDITEKHKLAKEIKARRREIQLILDTIPAHVWYKDAHNTILGLNQRAAASLGGRVRDFVGKNVSELAPPEIALRYHKNENEVISTQKPIRIIERYAPFSGRHGWFRTDKIPYKDPFTGKKCILIIAQEITSLKESQEALSRILESFDTQGMGDSLEECVAQLKLLEENLPKDIDRPQACKEFRAKVKLFLYRIEKLVDTIAEERGARGIKTGTYE